ncbi:MAG: MATE family efflux transporter [Anaerovoracaceae bacterium]
MQEGKSLKQQFVHYIIPSIAAQVVFTLYTMVDAIFVARGVSAKALAGVNISAPFVTALFAISITMAVGTSTQVGRLRGEGNAEKASGIFTMNFAVATIFSLVITILAFAFAGPFADALGATVNTRDYVIDYVRTIAPFAVFFIYSYLFEILLATDGFPAKATKIVTVGVVANFILDYIFIFIFHWGVFGAAFATGLSQLLVMMIYLMHFLGPKGSIKFRRFEFNIKEVAGSIYRGLPSGVMEVSPGVITFILVHFVKYNLGEDGLVSFSAMAYMAGIMIILAVGVAQGAQPLISYYNGKRDDAAIRTLLKYQLVTGISLELIMYVLICLLSSVYAGIFLSADAGYLIDYTAGMMKYYLIFAVIDGFTVIVSITMTGLEKPLPGIILSGLRCTVFLLIGCVITTLIGGDAIWFAMLIAELQTTVGGLIVLKKEFRKDR